MVPFLYDPFAFQRRLKILLSRKKCLSSNSCILELGPVVEKFRSWSGWFEVVRVQMSNLYSTLHNSITYQSFPTISKPKKPRPVSSTHPSNLRSIVLILNPEPVRRDRLAQLLFQRRNTEVHPSKTSLIGIVLPSTNRGLPTLGLVEQIQDVIMRLISNRWLGTFIVGYRNTVVLKLVVVAVALDVPFPPVQTRCAVWSEAGD